MVAGAVSLKKSHDIIVLSFSNIVKSQARYEKRHQIFISANSTKRRLIMKSRNQNSDKMF